MRCELPGSWMHCVAPATSLTWAMSHSNLPPLRHHRAGMVLAVRNAVAQALAGGYFPVVIGGECPLLLGCLAASRDAFGRVGLLFVDGHEDAWPPHASTTGEAADMELGLALGQSRLTGVPELAPILPVVRPEDTVLLGPRDKQEIQDAGLPSLAGVTRLVSDADLQRGDSAAIGRSAAEQVHTTAGRWWFHLDFDVLSSEALAAVRYPQPGGVNWRQLEQLTRSALRVPGVNGWNLTIYNPNLDPTGACAARIVEFIHAIAPSIPHDKT
jgi:arginase